MQQTRDRTLSTVATAEGAVFSSFRLLIGPISPLVPPLWCKGVRFQCWPFISAPCSCTPSTSEAAPRHTGRALPGLSPSRPPDRAVSLTAPQEAHPPWSVVQSTFRPGGFIGSTAPRPAEARGGVHAASDGSTRPAPAMPSRATCFSWVSRSFIEPQK